MIAIRKPLPSLSYTPVWHRAFLAMVPKIRRDAQHAFRKVRPELRQGFIAEVIANALLSGWWNLANRTSSLPPRSAASQWPRSASGGGSAADSAFGMSCRDAPSSESAFALKASIVSMMRKTAGNSLSSKTSGRRRLRLPQSGSTSPAGWGNCPVSAGKLP